MRAGDILVQSDLQYERYNTPRPKNFWDFITRAAGLGTPTGFGPAEPNVTIEEVQLDDELMFQTPNDLQDPPELASFPVTDPVEIVATHPTDAPLLVAGDGAGLVDAAAAGLIDGTELIRYSASHDRRRDRRRPRRRRHAARHRLQPQPGRAVDHRAPHTGLHRVTRRGAAVDRPHRQPAAHFPRPGRRLHDRDRRARRRRRPRHQLRQPDHVHERGAARAGRGRRPGHRVAHGGVLATPAASASSSPSPRRRRPTTSRLDPAHQRHPQPVHHRGAPALRRRGPDRRRAGPRVPRRAGPDRLRSRRAPSTRCPSRSWPTRRGSCPATRASPASASRRSRSATTLRSRTTPSCCRPTCSRRRAPTTSTTPWPSAMTPPAAGPERHDPPRRGAEHRAPGLAARRAVRSRSTATCGCTVVTRPTSSTRPWAGPTTGR